MKKIVIAFLLVLAIATSSSAAVNLVDRVLCKPVHLRSMDRYVLVNRVTGIVEYILSNGVYMPIKGGLYKKLQAAYNAQSAVQQSLGHRAKGSEISDKEVE